MKIDSAAVSQSSSHAASARRTVEQTVRAWTGDRPPDTGRAGAVAVAAPSAVVALSVAANPADGAAVADATPGAAEAAAIEDAAKAARESPQMRLIRAIVEFLTGRRIDGVDLTSLGSDIRAAQLEAPARPSPPGDPGWGVEVERREVLDESEATAYAASGVVRTADGREIAFTVALTMTRTWHEESATALQAGNARRRDPLVVEFDGRAAELSSARFRFDLDADGNAEDVPLLVGGSGYLALDRGGDGRIDSGAELFGPNQGDGYAELSAHDTDRNGWIDERDGVYRLLRIWTPDAGGGTLATLAERGVGAIHLGRVATPFELRSPTNESLGAVRTTGVWIGEDGGAGTVQQIDLSV